MNKFAVYFLLLACTASSYAQATDEWRLVFKVVQGSGIDVHSSWTNDAVTTPDTGKDAQNLCSSINFKSPLLKLWETTLNVKEVKVALYDDGEELQYFIFNARGITDRKAWFSEANLIESSYTDLNAENFNYFSLDGAIADQQAQNRHFFINRNYGGCLADAGWLAVMDVDGSDVCSWARQTNPPRFLYSSLSTYVNWNTGNIKQADVFAIFIKTGC